MSSFDWKSFLTQWSQEILESLGSDRGKLPPEVIQSGWFGYPGATEDQIAQAEARLGKTLPPSYRAFLKVTNGWRQTAFLNQLWSTKEIEWFAVTHRHWIDEFLKKSGHAATESPNASSSPFLISDQDYFVYGDEQDCSKIRPEYLQTALGISKPGEGAIYLLNPQIINADGEWEAWFFGDWLPGADRYRSFQEMMQAEYENFLELRETPSSTGSMLMDAIEPSDPAVVESQAPTIAPSTPDTIELTDASSLAASQVPIATSNANLASVETLPTPVSGKEAWNALASFNIEFQTRQVEQYAEQRTIAHHVETGAIETRSGIDPKTVQRWMLKQLKGSTTLPSTQEPIGLEIAQLRIIRARQLENPMVADSTQPLFLDAIKRGEPFSLEVSMNVIGAVLASLAERQLVYRAQCVAHNLTTRSNTNLGDVTTNVPVGDRAAYTAQFPEITLDQPGLYRLKVWVTLQNIAASPGYFKVPMLQVV